MCHIITWLSVSVVVYVLCTQVSLKNKGFNNNNFNLCQLTIATGAVFFLLLLILAQSLLTTGFASLQFHPLPENENQVEMIAVLTHWMRSSAQRHAYRHSSTFTERLDNNSRTEIGPEVRWWTWMWDWPNLNEVRLLILMDQFWSRLSSHASYSHPSRNPYSSFFCQRRLTSCCLRLSR